MNPQPVSQAAPSTMLHAAIDLGTLMRQYQLGLVLIAGASEEQTDATAALPVQWVHGTEMLDPTPFLTPRTVLLTTGSGFGDALSAEAADTYVERLRAAGITALGFGVGISWERIPPALIDACDRLALPLFRVPYDTPFLAIVQTAARLIDAQTHARDAWALESQRAVAGAALQRDGLAAAVREAAGRLGRWVAIADRTGRIIEFAPRGARGAAVSEWIRREARELIARGVRASRVRNLGDEPLRLQTLGRNAHLLGVLVTPVGDTPDHADRTLLGLVVALATVQLEHRTGVGNAETELRAAVVHLLLAGETELAERIARGVLPRLPRGRVAAVRLDELETHGTTLLEDLRSLAGGSTGLLTAPYGSGAVLVCEAAQLTAVRRVLEGHGVPAGVSERGTLDELGELISQAELALERAVAVSGSASGPGGPVDFRPSMHAGMLHLLDADPEARRRALALLSPVRKHDQRHDDAILSSLEVWLRHHGQTSPAAAEIGVHRHTLRSRMQTAASLLERDLDDPDARAELWAALRVAGAVG